MHSKRERSCQICFATLGENLSEFVIDSVQEHEVLDEQGQFKITIVQLSSNFVEDVEEIYSGSEYGPRLRPPKFEV